MKVLYLAPSDIQVARVDRQCIVAFCGALKEIGIEVELVALKIKTIDSEPRARRPLDLYRVRNEFPVRLVPVPVHQESRSWWIAINRFVVHLAITARRAFRRSSRPLVVYEKSYAPALALALLRVLLPGRPLFVFEAHLPPSNRLQRFVLRHADLVVANTHALAADLITAAGIDSDRVLGTHQGVDLASSAQSRLTQEEARKKLGLSPDKKLAVYTGKIYDGYREVDYMLEAAKLLRNDPEIELVLVGGRQDHVDRLRRRAVSEGIDNLTFTGFVPPTVVPAYQRAADLLLLYYPSGIELNRYRSPGKLFEYMASGRPIVAVDLPVLREVLGAEPAALTVPPDSPRGLAEAIRHLLADPVEAERLAWMARRRVTRFTWEARARAVIEAVERSRGRVLAKEGGPNVVAATGQAVRREEDG